MANHFPVRNAPLAVGDVVPDFTLPDQHKQDWTLSEHVRKGDVVLSFVPFAFTGVCGTEMGCISKDLAAWSGKGASVVGVDCDSVFANKAWAEREGYRHLILSDQLREVTKGLGLFWVDMNTTNRATVVIGKSPGGRGRVKFIQTRPPAQAMNWDQVLAMV